MILRKMLVTDALTYVMRSYHVEAGTTQDLAEQLLAEQPDMRVIQQAYIRVVPASNKAFTVLPKRWVVERTIGWLNRCRRLAKDWECLNKNALTFVRWAEQGRRDSTYTRFNFMANWP
jgi:hypothetical protein